MESADCCDADHNHHGSAVVFTDRGIRTVDVTRTASIALASRREVSKGVQAVALPSRNYLLEMFAEFSRAVSAAQRYEDLRYRSGGRGRIAPADIPRQIFEEFYAADETVELRRPERRRSDSHGRQPGAAKALS
jgi:hypothetical protein